MMENENQINKTPCHGNRPVNCGSKRPKHAWLLQKLLEQIQNPMYSAGPSLGWRGVLFLPKLISYCLIILISFTLDICLACVLLRELLGEMI